MTERTSLAVGERAWICLLAWKGREVGACVQCWILRGKLEGTDPSRRELGFCWRKTWRWKLLGCFLKFEGWFRTWYWTAEGDGSTGLRLYETQYYLLMLERIDVGLRSKFKRTTTARGSNEEARRAKKQRLFGHYFMRQRMNQSFKHITKSHVLTVNRQLLFTRSWTSTIPSCYLGSWTAHLFSKHQRLILRNEIVSQ